MDAGVRPIEDPWLVSQLKRQARDVHLKSVFTALGLTGLVLLVPG